LVYRRKLNLIWEQWIQHQGWTLILVTMDWSWVIQRQNLELGFQYLIHWCATCLMEIALSLCWLGMFKWLRTSRGWMKRLMTSSTQTWIWYGISLLWIMTFRNKDSYRNIRCINNNLVMDCLKYQKTLKKASMH
jgi:hypothetical protein